MTGDPLLDLAISFVGTVLLVALSWALGAWRSAAVDEAAAAARLAFDEPDFRPSAWLVSEDGRAALAADEAGREFALVFAVGDGLATRRAALGSRPAQRDGRAVTILLNEFSKRRVRLVARDESAAEDWAGRLAKPALG
jgi:hypothetical protein